MTDPIVDAVVARLYGPEKDGHEACRAEAEQLRTDIALLVAALQDAVKSTGGALIVQDYGRLNRALLLGQDK